MIDFFFKKPVRPPDMDVDTHLGRFQTQTWFRKLLRLLHLFYIPYFAISTWLWNAFDERTWPLDPRFHFNLGVSAALFRMKYIVSKSESDQRIARLWSVRKWKTENR
jgi:hypothetical protein